MSTSSPRPEAAKRKRHLPHPINHFSTQPLRRRTQQTLEEHVYNGASALTYSVYHVFGPGAVGGLSGSARHPATPAFPRGGMVHGPLRVAELVDYIGDTEWKYRYEDQLGSLIGMADDAGNKLADYVYLDYGRAVERPIAFDGDHDLVFEAHSSAGAGVSQIGLNSAMLSANELKGMQFAVADPNNGQILVGTITANSTSSIEVDDPEEAIFSAVIESDLTFVVYDFVDTNVATSGTYHTAGEWTSNPSYSSPSTTFTDSGADFKSYMVGWLIGVKVEDFTYLEITDVPSSTTVKVKGDASTLAASGDRYWLFAPPHVDPSTGALRGSNDGGTFIPDYDTHYLWGLYRYQPPMTGYFVDPDGAPVEGVYGAQTEANKAGNYYAGARTYDPNTGRWTTTDPATTPWSNLLIFSLLNPVRIVDPTGLGNGIPNDRVAGNTWGEGEFEDALRKVAQELIDRAIKHHKDQIEEADDDEKEELTNELVRQIKGAYETKEELRKLHGDGSWQDDLPDCPCENPDRDENGNLKNPVPNDDGWARNDANQTYHPGAKDCFRSYPGTSDGYGQQCCYDERGKLITGGQAAGTPDLMAVALGEDDDGLAAHVDWHVFDCGARALTHYMLDVHPFEVLGWDLYNKLWKPNNGNNCEENIK